MDGGRMIQNLLLSNEPAYIDHFHSIFEDLWAKGIDAEDRIKEIHEGTDLTDIEIIQNPREGIERAWSYVEKSKYEVLSIFATPNAFRRQMDMGLSQVSYPMSLCHLPNVLSRYSDTAVFCSSM